MRPNVVVSNMIFALLMACHSAQGAAGDPIKIVISAGGLPAPIAITDPTVTARFKVGSGPGTFTLQPDGTRITKNEPSMIVDWPAGTVSPPTATLNTAYEVSFVIPRRGTYYAYYWIDPATKHGYVYLPGPGEPHYKSNIAMIQRGVEGIWFHAWNTWEEVANPLISQAGR
jgi:hypothetical protein